MIVIIVIPVIAADEVAEMCSGLGKSDSVAVLMHTCRQGMVGWSSTWLHDVALFH